MKKISTLMAMAIIILFSGCSPSANMTSSHTNSLGNSNVKNSCVQGSTQISSSIISNQNSSAQSMNQNSSESLENSRADTNNEGNQIDITGSNTPDIPSANCLEPYHIGFNIQNISSKPISKILIRATDLDGCAVNIDNDLDQLPLNKTYRGTEWDYAGPIKPEEIAACDLYVIPKQLSYQTLVFQFFMADGKTPFRNANNNTEVVKVRFGIKEGDPIPTSEPFNASDIDIGGKLVYSQSDQSHYIVFNIKNTAYFSTLNGIMLKIPIKDYAGYKIVTIQGGTVDTENGYYVWKFPQMLAQSTKENITISCPSDKPPKSGFDFYTLDGKTKICTCQVVPG